MRLTRSGAALLLRRARAPDDLRYRGSDRPGSEPKSAGAEVWNLECTLENKAPRAFGGISARRFHFPGFGSRTAREGNDNHGEAEAQAPRDSEDRRLGAAAPRIPSPSLGPGPAGGGASQPGLGVGHSPPRRPPAGLATSPRWHLNLGCLRLATSTAAAH